VAISHARDPEPPPYTFRVAEAQLDACWNLFEPPTADEQRPRG
jgi:hypothetical protein